MKKTPITALILALIIIFSGCGAFSAETAEIPAGFALSDVSEWFSGRDSDAGYDEKNAARILLNGSSAQCGHKAVEIDGGVITIIDEGDFIVSGALDDGYITILAEKKDKVHIVLEGASIHSETCAAIYVQQADKVFITLAEGTENSLSNGGKFESIDENNIDGVIFSKDDLTLNGAGKLAIASPGGHGIVSKDDLVIAGGSYEIESAGHGVSGKDSIGVSGGNFALKTGKDGLHSEHDEADMGNIYIREGAFEIVSGGDGVSASGNLRIDGGEFDIVSGGGSGEAQPRQQAWGRGHYQAEASDIPSAKGLKSGGGLWVSGGNYALDALDDALHSDGSAFITGGDFAIQTGDDGMHANETLSISHGKIDISQSYEGLEAENIEILGGEISLIASDDGLNAAGGNDESGFGGSMADDAFGRGNPFAAGTGSIAVSGGKLLIHAEGDGIDSNGSLSVSGGYTIVSGPTNGGNGALDFGSEGTISGGTFIALGSAGMAMNFSSAENQGAMMVSLSGQPGDEIILADASGNEILSLTAEKSFSSIIVSCPEIRQGESYTLSCGDESQTVSMDSLLYGSGNGMGFGRRGGMNFGGGKNFGMRGGRNFSDTQNGADEENSSDNQTIPDGMTPPEGMNGQPPEMPDGMTPPDGAMAFPGGNMFQPSGMMGGMPPMGQPR